jgi:hypothetical protein
VSNGITAPAVALLGLVFLASCGCNARSGAEATTGKRPRALAASGPPTAGVWFRAIVDKVPAFLSPPDELFVHVFEVENDTARTVRIKKCTPSCGCVDANITKQELRPGDKAELRLTVRLHNKHGPQRFSAQLISEDGAPRIYGVETTVYQDGEVDPRMVQLGLIPPLQAASKDVAINTYGAGQEPGRITSVRSTLPTLDASICDSHEPESVEDHITRRTTTVRLTLRASDRLGFGAAEIRVTLTAATGVAQSIRIPVQWQVQSPYLVSPARAFFGTVSDTNGALCRPIVIAVRRRDGKPLSIRRAESTNPAFRVSVTCDGGIAHVTASLAKPSMVQKGHALTGQLVLATNDPKSPSITISASALP